MFALFSALAELEIACEQDFLALNKRDFSADVENNVFNLKHWFQIEFRSISKNH